MSQSTGEPALDLIAAVYASAVKDATRGDAEAIEWLDTLAPDWRERIRRQPRPVEREDIDT